MSIPVVVVTFLVFLAAFTGVGVLSARVKEDTTDDYLVASRTIPGWMTGLSAVSTNHSGFMFIGLIGFTWRFGVEAVWLMAGWFLGDLLCWWWVHHRVRERSEAIEAASFPALLGTRADGSRDVWVTRAAGLLTFFFLGGYAAAQINAGGVTLHALFGWPMAAGAIIGTVIVVLYCFSGGLRASIWTDSAQAIVMVGAMAALLASCMMRAGGFEALGDQLRAIDPSLLQWVPDDLAFGFVMYLVGFTAAGVGVIGQPHIMVRFMAIRDTKSIRTAGTVYFVWYALFTFAAILVGLYGRVLLPDLAAGVPDDQVAAATELAMPTLAMAVLPDVLVGLTLAGLFSATMSTADSQILSCSAAITQDVAPRFRHDYRASKISTLAVAALALGIALAANDGVFALVVGAWSALGAAFGPILLVRLARAPLPSWLAGAMMVAGPATVFAWGATPWSASLFRLLPGLLVPLALYGTWSALGRPGTPREG